jgi:hypothetical protein
MIMVMMMMMMMNRKTMVRKGESTAEKELRFCDLVFTKHPKAQEAWFHRLGPFHTLPVDMPEDLIGMFDLISMQEVACGDGRGE